MKKIILILITVLFYINLFAQKESSNISKIDSIKPDFEEWSKQAVAESSSWLQKKGIELNSLPKAPKEQIVYTCNSKVLLRERNDDTLKLWTSGGELYLDTLKLLEHIDKPSFGKTNYISEISSNGNFTLVFLRQKTFHIKNDSSFELETFYKISLDSMMQLWTKKFEFINDSIKNDSIMNIININSYDDFKLIFHPDIFPNGVYSGNIFKDRIELESHWIANNKNYYRISIKNEFLGGKTEYSYLFDENYKFLKYEGCFKEELSLLKEENKKENGSQQSIKRQ